MPRFRKYSVLSTQYSVLVLALALAAAAPAADPAPPKGFTALFNGKDFTGWHGWDIHTKGASPYDVAAMSPEERAKKRAEWTESAKKHWKVENGEIVHDGKDGKTSLATDKDYGDFELLVEYKIVPKADSGIYLRATPQVQVWDPVNTAQKGNPGTGSGGLFNNSPKSPGQSPLVQADKPAGEWNKFRIIMAGEKATVYLNDKLVVDHATLENYWDRAAKKSPPRPVPAKAPILLQAHPPGEVRWRNIYIREIPPEEANEILKKKAGGGFKPVSTKSLDGWQGAVANYEVIDGAIACKKGKGGVLFTAERFADFAVQLEYKVPPGGNNGLAIRYPGKGQASYDAMCELQILDDDAPKYAKLDPRQFNGSAYGMAASHKGFQRPAGTWNFMLVTVQGPTIKVDLNGSRILATDLSKVTEYQGNRKHPGKDVKEGHFGFCGHSDPVAFRNVAIKPLPTAH
jgi:hypothetical protein